ncbi:EAL domain-containing protein [Chitinilyticum piscinae]|uniref:EAL domain-containing protein n=1 Tax=Chitinilyticum piscinae TaxID=2866724 RepID=A0A8J7FG92_9NEIS|nr:EAL domain-containing protein [Chitinilyticum piscinae]MBE9608530.1 EAL domain-containing protein [Chitinilyticum piscinae]
MNSPSFPELLQLWITERGDPLDGGWSRVEWVRAEARSLIARTLGLTLGSVFQPLFDRNGQLSGHEALLRTSARGRPVAPLRAFSIAALQGELVTFDRLCRVLHLVNYLQLDGPSLPLSLNVHPTHLLEINERHGAFFGHVRERLGAARLPITLEVTEENISSNQSAVLRNAIRNYREQGFQIAVDDFGAGSANIDRIWQLEPDYVKLDRQFIARAEQDERTRRALPRVVALMHELGSRVVIEGIENPLQYRMALDAGANLLQGYWLGRPAPQPLPAPPVEVAA